MNKWAVEQEWIWRNTQLSLLWGQHYLGTAWPDLISRCHVATSEFFKNWISDHTVPTRYTQLNGIGVRLVNRSQLKTLNQRGNREKVYYEALDHSEEAVQCSANISRFEFRFRGLRYSSRSRSLPHCLNPEQWRYEWSGRCENGLRGRSTGYFGWWPIHKANQDSMKDILTPTQHKQLHNCSRWAFAHI